MLEQGLERLIINFGLMAVESDASRAKLLEFVETLRHGNVVGASTSDIPIGHISWNFSKKYLSFPQVLQIVKGDFQNKMLSRTICELHWSWTLWMLWFEYHYAGYRWRIWIGGQYLSYDTTWGIGGFLGWTKYCKKFKLLYIYFWKNLI